MNQLNLFHSGAPAGGNIATPEVSGNLINESIVQQIMSNTDTAPTTTPPANNGALTPQQQQSLLVSVHFPLCRQSFGDESEAENVEKNNHAQRGVSRVSIYYFKQKMDGKEVDALAELRSYAGMWRRLHRRYTRTWEGEMRLLPAILAPAYWAMDAKMRAGFPAVKQRFLDAYPDWEKTAPFRMGDLYQASDFPSLSEVTAKIGYDVSIIPLADADQWKRITLIAPDLASLMEKTSNETVAKKMEALHKETWTDLITPVQKIIETLTKDKPRIFDTLIGNLTDMLTLAQGFNMQNDPTMNAFIAEAKSSLATVNADDLRQDPEVRKTAVKNATSLLAKFGQFGNRKIS